MNYLYTLLFYEKPDFGYYTYENSTQNLNVIKNKDQIF